MCAAENRNNLANKTATIIIFVLHTHTLRFFCFVVVRLFWLVFFRVCDYHFVELMSENKRKKSHESSRWKNSSIFLFLLSISFYCFFLVELHKNEMLEFSRWNAFFCKSHYSFFIFEQITKFFRQPIKPTKKNKIVFYTIKIWATVT